MISLGRLLDGVEVSAAELLAVHAIRRDHFLDCGERNGPTIYYPLSGSGLVELTGGDAVRFPRRCVIVLPPRRRARILPENGLRRTRGGQPSLRWRKLEAGTDDCNIVMACIGARITYQGSVGLFDNLRDPLIENLADNDPIRASFEELLDEVASQQPGSRAMAETLLRRCLILLFRRYFERRECRLSWLATLEDARISRAVSAMHDRPEHCFTLPQLAEVAGMSRSVFAAHFTDILGQSPMEFLKALRLARAAHLLTHTDLPVKGIAGRVGYSSRSSFTRAFLACHGTAPTAFRATAREVSLGSDTSAEVAKVA